VKRIIGIGNRLVEDDAIGPRVVDLLADRELPEDVDLVEGGLSGLDLLTSFSGCDRIVLVDAVSGYGRPGQTMSIRAEDAAATGEDRYDHAAGLGSLLRAWSCISPGDDVEIRVLGVEAPASDADLEEAATRALRLACDSPRGPAT